VYGVVGKARETAGGLVDMNFRFISARGLREAQNSFDD
jgi:hypothetical protein